MKQKYKIKKIDKKEGHGALAEAGIRLYSGIW